MNHILQKFVKFNVALLGGALMTLALFYTMQRLIHVEYVTTAPESRGVVELPVMPMYELEPVRNIPKPEKPEEPEEAPPIDIPPPTISGKSGTGTGIITKGKEVPIGADIIDPFSVSDSNAIALVQVQPVYPQRALQKEIEGYVVVEFDVDEGGRVINPRVLYAEPEGYFETASLRALERYRYQPRVVNGQTVKMFGVQQKLSFTLAD